MSGTNYLSIYDFDRVTIAVGPILVDGFQDGEGFVLEPATETFTYVVGTDGKVARSKTLNRTAKLTINLLQTSATNDQFSALHILDRDAPNGAGIVPLWIRDQNGRALYSATQCWISKAPTATFDREATVRVWEISIARLERIDGGN
jgi:hypothetical protein